MIKRILALAVVLMIFWVVFASCGCPNQPPSGLEETPASDFKYEYNASINGIAITKYTGSSIKVRIPEKIEDKPVTGIGERAFAQSGIIEIYIPDKVVRIAEYAFSECSGLTSIMIPDSVTQIGNWAFSRCSGLAYVAYKDGAYRYDANVNNLQREFYDTVNGEK